MLNRFDDVQHLPLRVYNRVAFLYNIKEDSGEKAAEEYVEQFNSGERAQMAAMIEYIKQNGVEAAKKFVTKDLKITYIEGEDEQSE